MSIKAALGLVALLFSTAAAAQINPNQIGWTVGTTGCSTATYLWSPADNQCEAPGGGGGGGLAGVSPQTSNYTAASGDNGKMIYFTLATAQTLTLPTGLSSTWAALASNSWSSAAPLTIAWPSGTTLDGYASSCTASFNPGGGGWIFFNGTNFYTRIGTVLSFSCVIPTLAQSVFEADCGGMAGNCNSITIPTAVSPGQAIVLDLFHDNGGTTAPSDSQEDTFTLENYQLVTANFDCSEYVVCGAEGGPTTINFGTAPNYNAAAAYVVSNVATSSCVDGASSGQGKNVATVGTGSITTTAANDFILVVGAARTGAGGTTITEANSYSPLESSGLIDGALTYNSWGGLQVGTGSLSDTLSFTNSPGGQYASILALKPGAAATLITGDLIVAGPNGQPQPLKHGPAGTVMTSNGEGAVPSDQAIPPLKWPPSGSQPTFSPAAGSIPSGSTVTDTCPGSATPWISSGLTPVAGATGIAVSSPESLYGSCQGSGYFTTGQAAYTVTTGPTYVLGSAGNGFNGATLGVTGTSGWTVVVIAFANNYGELTGGISDGLGTTYTRRCSLGTAETGNPLMYVYTGPLTSSGTVTVALAGTDTPMETVVAEYANANTGTPLNVACATNSTSGAASLTIPGTGSMTTSATTTLFTALGVAGAVTSSITTSGYSFRSQSGASSRYVAFGDYAAQAAGNYSVVWNPGNSSDTAYGMLIALQ